ncbi:RagB/SusD family nutrient uptake outer membrane protein [Parabacteroides sp.]
MKNYFKYICLSLALTGITGCSDVLDINDYESYSPDNVWNDQKLSEAYLSNLYSETFSGWPVNSGMNADETSGIIGKEYVMPNNDSFKYWPYDKIYKINLMLEGLEDGALADELKIKLKGEALFLRAYHYFKALVYHGGIPYIVNVQEQGTDDLYVSRNSSAECFDLLVKDLDEAIKSLPEHNTGSDYGHIDASAALALKAKVLLYKASPQFNPQSKYANPYVDEAYEVNKLAYETLVDRGYGLVDDYTDVFETKGHKEAVIAVIYNNPNKKDGRDEQTCRPLSQSKDNTGGDQVIWDLVEAYPMKDGKKIGVSDKYTYDIQTYWKNRDPRFEASQVWNGAIFELSSIKGRRQYTVYNIAHLDDAFCINTPSHNRTGFYPRKGIMESNSQAEVKNNDFDWLDMRFAEVMFNYAEIACAKGITEVGYTVLKQIRERAGIEPGTDGLYGLQANMNADEMRKALLDEKRIEFVFEGQRFWDLRRNRMLDQIDGKHKYGLLGEYKGEITPEVQQKASKYELLPEDFTYKVQELFSPGEKAMYTPDTYYFFPIKQSSIEQNTNLQQNKDWGGSFNPALE